MELEATSMNIRYSRENLGDTIESVRLELIVMEDNLVELEELMESPSKCEELTVKCNGKYWLLKDCVVCGMDVEVPSSGPSSASLDIIVEKVEPAFTEVIFTNGKKKVLVKDYDMVKNNYGDPTKMSYEEFKEKIMIDEL